MMISRLYPTWLMIKQIGGGSVPVRRNDAGNRASAVLVEEYRTFEIPIMLDDTLDSVAKISEIHHEGSVMSCQKLGVKCGSRHVSEAYQFFSKKECIQVIVQQFLRRTQAMHP
jgi:hypothetical protein